MSACECIGQLNVESMRAVNLPSCVLKKMKGCMEGLRIVCLLPTTREKRDSLSIREGRGTFDDEFLEIVET